MIFLVARSIRIRKLNKGRCLRVISVTYFYTSTTLIFIFGADVRSIGCDTS